MTSPQDTPPTPDAWQIIAFKYARGQIDGGMSRDEVTAWLRDRCNHLSPTEADAVVMRFWLDQEPHGNGKAHQPPSTYETAKALVDAGISVAPIKRDGSKMPAVPWKKYQSEHATDADLRRWYDNATPYGIATIGGKVSGHLEIIDFDREDLFEPWRELVEAQAPGLVARLNIVRSPRPGRHVRYRCTAVEISGNDDFAEEWITDQKTGKPKKSALIESRGEGGYALAPRTPPECHKTGGIYEHIAGPPMTELPDITAEERDILLTTARMFDECAEEPAAAASNSSGTELRPGDDFNRRGPTWEEILPSGWDHLHTDAKGIKYIRRPGKTGHGCSATIGCQSKNGVELFRVFSSNADPFEPGAYSKFAVYAIVNHKGDFKAAAKDLAEQGYGDQKPKKKKQANAKGKGNAPDTDDMFRHTDMGNAQRFTHQHGDKVRYCWLWKKWLVWDGTRWVTDHTGRVIHLAKQTVRSMIAQAAELSKKAADEPDDAKRAQLSAIAEALLDHARKSEDARVLARMVTLAQSEPGIPIMPQDMDADRWQLNCANVTIDLRTGKTRPHDPADNITKLCPTNYNPDAECPRFIAAMDGIHAGDDAVLEFQQCYLGYGLTGDVREQLLPFWWGGGSNGKSTEQNAVLETIGPDYAGMVPVELLMEQQGEQHPTILADLHGKRLLFAAETDNGRRLNENRLKALTGGERIKARRMKEDFWEFSPTHKLVLVTNHKPEVRGTDHAVWRRVRLVPFTAQFLDPNLPENAGKCIPPDQCIDRGLPEALQGEREGILAWLVRGCLLWQERGGLPAPAAVMAATKEYRDDQDVLATFIAEVCQTGSDDYRVPASELYQRYVQWAEAAGETPFKQRRFGEAMTEKGYRRITNNGTWYLGIAILVGNKVATAANGSSQKRTAYSTN